jgi:hypothetical protein
MNNVVPSICDQKELLSQLRRMDMKATCGDTGDLSMADIISRISEVKSRATTKAATTSSMTPNTSRPNSSLTPLKSPNGRSMASRVQSPVSLHKQDHSIARFRTPEPKWDKSPHTAEPLLKSLYRIPDFDCTGKHVFSLGREEAKGCVTWVPPEADRSIPPVTPQACTASFQAILAKHLESTVVGVDNDVGMLPARTEKERNIKARAGADLFNLQQTMHRLHGEGIVPTSKRALSPTLKKTH